MSENSIIRILTAAESSDEVHRLERCMAIAGAGLEGDRYATGRGYYSGMSEWDAQVTLMSVEPFEEIERSHGCVIDPDSLRRNVITRGVDLKSLIGRRFRIGPEVILFGRKPWPPCSYIVGRTGRAEIFRYLARDTGIGANVIVGGTISVGDRIEVLD